jgi:hypothetical protein
VSRKILLLAAAAFALCLCPVSTPAQGTAAPPAQRSDAPREATRQEAAQVPTESADLAITATVTARELLFEVVPNPTVEFPGKPERDTVWDAVRENLPRPVEPGVTYRNIGIRLKIVSRFRDIERIVAEALGEVPVTDEVLPPDDATPRPNATPPAAPNPQPNGGSP